MSRDWATTPHIFDIKQSYYYYYCYQYNYIPVI